MLNKYLVWIIIPLFTFCKSDRINLIQTLENEFSEEEINLFYLANFSGKSQDHNVYYWKKNIKIAILDSDCKEDSLVIERVIKLYNSIDLPLNFSIVHENKANCVIRFVDSLKRETAGAITNRLEDLKEGIYFVLVDVLNNFDSNQKEAILIHEFLHLLGLSGHITTDANSIFYNYYSPNINELDQQTKQVLKMLYNVDWPRKYSKQDFENDFSEKLYPLNKQKILTEFITKNNINIEFVNDLFNNFMLTSNGAIFKYPNNIGVYVTTDGCEAFKDSLVLAIDQINNFSNQFKIKYSNEPREAGIFISINYDENISDSTYYENVSYDNKSKEIINTTSKFSLTIKVKPNNKFSTHNLVPKLYGIIVSKNTDTQSWNSVIDLKTKSVKPYFQDYYNFYNSPYLVGNITKDELEEVYNKIKNQR